MNNKCVCFMLVFMVISGNFIIADTYEKRDVLKEGMILIMSPDMQKEIKLSESQKAKIETIFKKAKSELEQLNREKRLERMVEIQSAAEKQMAEILNEEQKNRFLQLEIQYLGVRALANEEVAKKLNLSTEQIEKIKEIYSIEKQEMYKLSQETANTQELKPKLSKLRENNNEKALTLLSANQRSKVIGTKINITRKTIVQP